jgi:hypothetical protein
MIFISIAYIIIALISIRPLTGHIAWHISDNYNQSEPDGMDWGLGMFIGIICASIWPVLAIGIPTLLLIDKLSPAVGAERKAIKRKKAEEFEKTQKELELEPWS